MECYLVTEARKALVLQVVGGGGNSQLLFIYYLFILLLLSLLLLSLLLSLLHIHMYLLSFFIGEGWNVTS